LNKDQAVGALILVASVAGILIYGWLIIFVNPIVVLVITALVAVAAVLLILAWIGYVMATTPPPPPLELEPTATTTPTSTGPEKPEAGGAEKSV
jgi:predicted DNA-binding transcriptional regulator